jgi:hypothetical protein
MGGEVWQDLVKFFLLGGRDPAGELGAKSAVAQEADGHEAGGDVDAWGDDFLLGGPLEHADDPLDTLVDGPLAEGVFLVDDGAVALAVEDGFFAEPWCEKPVHEFLEAPGAEVAHEGFAEGGAEVAQGQPEVPGFG